MKKKLLSVILAVAVAFTFSFAMVGTASADAAGKYFTSWESDFSKVTVNQYNTGESGSYVKVGTYNASRYWMKNNGDIWAVVEISTPVGGTAPAWLNNEVDWAEGSANPAITGAYYVDLSGAKLVQEVTPKVGSPYYTEYAPTYASIASFKTNVGPTTDEDGVTTLPEAYFEGLYVQNSAPTYVNNYSQLETADKTYCNDCASKYFNTLLTAETTGYNPKSYEAQTLEFTSVATDAAKDALKDGKLKRAMGETYVAYAGIIGSAKCTVKINASTAAAATVDDAAFYIDEVTGEDEDQLIQNLVTNPTTYDGSEHVIKVGPEGLTATWVKAYAATYEKLEKAEPEAVTSPAFKDAGWYYFGATVSDAKGNMKDCELIIHVAKADAKIYFKNRVATGITDIVLGGKSAQELGDDTYQQIIDRIAIVESKDYDAENLNALVDFEVNASKKADDYDAHVAALAANKDEIVAAFEEGYAIEEAAAASLPTITLKNYSVVGIKALSIEKKLTTKEWKAYTEKYETLFNNINISYKMDTNIGADAYAVLIEKTNTADDEVAFTKCPSTLKGYSKKSRTYTVKAEAESGNTVYFKLTGAPTSKVTIDKTSGKITVKKGLKKGKKYSITVKAYTKASNGYAKASDAQTFTLKIVK